MTSITDLDSDSLAHCAAYLSLQDISNLATTCKSLKRGAYSDAIWLHRFSQSWPEQPPPRVPQSSCTTIRDAYLRRHSELRQFKFSDPVVGHLYTSSKPFDHVLIDKKDLIFSQGSGIIIAKIDSFLSGKAATAVVLSDHKAKITCMRLFPLSETTLVKTETRREQNFLVTSSSDHSIRFWWKGSCQRCFRGHNGPVLTLSDKLLGDGGAKVLGSGGEDCTVRLWSLSAGGKRGEHALKATLYGHQKPVKLMAVARHKTNLLVTIARDSKVRVWDATASSAAALSSCCVGMSSVPGAPLGMKCHDSLLYVAAGSSVVALDLRTMRRVLTAAFYRQELCSFAIMPSKSLICTGGDGKAMLWDIRRNQNAQKSQPIAELDGHTGPVTLLHMDPYKIITGGPEDNHVNAWEVDTGTQTNSLTCLPAEDASTWSGCSAMAVNGTQIVTASRSEELGFVRYRDFSNANHSLSRSEVHQGSKFWSPLSDYESDAGSIDNWI